LKLGKIVPVDIEIRPHSRIFHKGRQLQVNSKNLLGSGYLKLGRE
jgi:hypothetical protein